jgi:hypothetical protein
VLVICNNNNNDSDIAIISEHIALKQGGGEKLQLGSHQKSGEFLVALLLLPEQLWLIY